MSVTDSNMESESPSFAEETASNMLKELQSWWEIPSMAQYISLFREAFNLPEIEIEELENGLIDDCVKGPNEWLENLIIAFLKSIMPGRVNPTNWDLHLRRLVKRKWVQSPYADKENPYAGEEEKSFRELNLRYKVEVLYCLSLFRLDNNDIADIMKSMDAEALRVQKLGVDDANNTYWYFYGTRLYKEELPVEEKKTWDEEWNEQKRKSSLPKKRGRGRPRRTPRKQNVENETEDEPKEDDRFMNISEKSRWSVVCDTLEEWVNFAEKFKNSKSKNEKSLFTILQENFLPTLKAIYEEKERKLQEKIKALLPPVPAREKIVTRRETRKMRGETGGDINYALLNGYYSDEDYNNSNEDFKVTTEVKSRAERLEERNKRAIEALNNSRKRVKHNEDVNHNEDLNHNEDNSKESSSESSENSSSPDVSEGVEVDLMSQMVKLLSSVKLHKDAWPFLYPVNEDDAPGYYDIIKDPVDLSTIEHRLHKGKYETVGDLDEDFSKLVSNCELYNGEHHAYSKMAQTLRTLFRKEVAALLEMVETISSSNADSEESNDGESHSSSNSNASSSPPHEPHEDESNKEHKKVKSKKKKRKHINQEALDMLAQAADAAVKQINTENSPSPPQKKSPVPQEIQPKSCHVPSTNMPCYAVPSSSPSTNKASIPIPNSSYISGMLNSSPKTIPKNKPVIIRANKSNTDSIRPVENTATTSSNTTSVKISNMQQTNVNQSVSPKTVPIILSRSPPNQRVQNNPMPAVTMQSNICLPNGLPVQQIILPAGTQLPSTGQQYIFSSPQSSIRTVQLQNNAGQMNQGYVKVVPQIITSPHVMQISKNTMPSYQYQTLSPNTTQTFTQVAQNSQFLNVPYVVHNQNSLPNSTSQPAVNYQPYQMPPRPMHIGGQGNS